MKRSYRIGLAAVLLIAVLVAVPVFSAPKQIVIRINLPVLPDNYQTVGLDPLNWNNNLQMLEVNLFEQLNPDIKIEPMNIDFWSDKGTQNLNTALSGGTAPAVFPAIGDNVLPWQAEGAFADITKYVNAWDKKSVVPQTLMDDCMVQGKYYAIPGNYYHDDVMAYRKSYLKEAGVKEPSFDWTIDDFIKIAQAVTNGKDRWGFTVAAGDWATGWHLGEYWMGSAIGGPSGIYGYPWVVPDKSGQYTWRCSPAKYWAQVLQLLQDLTFKYKCVLTGVDEGWGTLVQDWDSGRVAMRFMYSQWVYGTLSNKGQEGKIQPEDVGAVPVMYGPTGLTKIDIGCNFWGVNSALSPAEQEAAWKWLNFWLSGQGNVLDYAVRAEFNQFPSMMPLYNPLPKKMADQVLPEWDKAVQKVASYPAGPSAVSCGVIFTKGSQMKDAMTAPVQAVVTDPNADCMKVAQDFVDYVNKTVLNYKEDPNPTPADFKAYYDQLGAYYKANFPDHYQKVFLPLYNNEYKVW